jgi:hypothetical protein
LYAIACQLSPMPQSSGIQGIETDTFKLTCSQTLTGKTPQRYHSHWIKNNFSSFQVSNLLSSVTQNRRVLISCWKNCMKFTPTMHWKTHSTVLTCLSGKATFSPY